MLRIVNLEQIQAMLLHIPALVDLQDQQDPNFVQEVKQWLTKLEKIFDNNRRPEAGIIAALRGMVISAERGVLPIELKIHGRTTRRKISTAAAAYVVQEISNLIANITQNDNERLAEAERLTRQLVSIAKSKGLIQELPGGDNFTDILKVIWRKMSADLDLSPGVVNVEGLLGPSDALIILDRTIASDIPKE